MLELVIELKSLIRVFINKHFSNLYKNKLSYNKWDTIYKMIAILKPFKDAIKSIEGD